MNKFKENDIVKCIDNTDVPSLVIGMNYRVRDCGNMYVELSVDYADENDKYIPNKFNPERFELTDEKATYVWPTRQRLCFSDGEVLEAMLYSKPSYEELEIRLEIAERLLEESVEQINWWQDEHCCCLGYSDKFLAEVEEFLEEQ